MAKKHHPSRKRHHPIFWDILLILAVCAMIFYTFQIFI
jgi:hypothetical protein